MTGKAGNRVPDTEALIRALGAGAGGGRPPRLGTGTILALAAGAALAAALAVVLLVAGPRPDLAHAAGRWIVQFKAIAMALLALGAGGLVRAAAEPGRPWRPLPLLGPGLLFLLLNLLLDRTGYPIAGAHSWSVPACVGTIVLASLPALLAVTAAVRAGIPTRPARAGAACGLLAGTLAALAYSVACVNDGAAFVTIWYGAALAISTMLGALAGRRALAW